jgi:hypothetical protein
VQQWHPDCPPTACAASSSPWQRRRGRQRGTGSSGASWNCMQSL